MKSLNIVFMGTPEFAVASLEALVQSHHKVVAVVTAPDKPQGRGLIPAPSPVKTCALKYSIPVLQPEKLKSEEFHTELKSFQADLFIVVAFRMLPEAVWSMPALGSVNLHASLLPKYRGAAPINHAIINNETETGITTFRLKHEIDTGNILFAEREPIFPEDDAGSLYERLMVKGADLILKTANAIAEGTAVETPQPSITGALPVAPKIFKETCKIDWTKSTREILNQIRGLSPYPGSWTVLNDKTFKIFKAVISSSTKDGKPGSIFSDGKDNLEVRCNDGWLSILNLQPEGKKRMNTQEFFRGNKI
jgi:methionyl-tRNA formyltransferase